MRTRTLHCFALLAVLCAVGHALGHGTPTRVKDILYARPFTLEQGYRSPWHREIPLVTSGYVVVLAIDPGIRRPGSGAVRVLLAGDRTVEEFNSGFTSGILVGVIPGTPDLAETLFWLGPLGFADEMTATKIAQSRVEAIGAGITPFAPDKISQALAEGGVPLMVPNRAALRQHVLPLIQTYHAED